ncbi:U1 small nuclear ribonucleoprotein 70 kDa-like [Stegodyphus dumicola]|uniref:U1 small nuclear ribonucleoprotein 70 kDa-like n=1 Tax=Stegodyphus dumicola TaxID=202533 RepID=UPI0015AB9DC1|nr:U1 small nuclear ribonucleoprotein 70 kDa-like [Stegodyphus dumicola]
MTQFLPPNLLAHFAPRDPIPYLPPVDKLPYEKKTAGYTGIASFVNQFEDPKNTPPPLRIETREERQERKRKEKAEQVAYKLEQDIALWSPAGNPAATTDPYKTLFVARVNYDTSESKLRREFEIYGHIKKIVIVHDKNTGKPRGYAFIEYERERDMHSAYKHADGKKIDGRRVLVDVERGRTVKGWLPRRLGGGLGGTRRGGPEVNVKHSGREEPRLEERYLDRERPERPERRRSRSRSRERRRRSRSRSRERHRAERHKRDRSRDRVRDRETGPVFEKVEPNADVVGDAVPEVDARKERRRSRSRDRDRKRRRSRSRDRDRKRRDYDRDRESRRERGGRDQDERIKEEPVAPPETSQDGFNNSGFDGEYNYNNNSNMEPAAYEGY